MRLNAVYFLAFSGFVISGCAVQPRASDNVITDEPRVVTIPLAGSTRDIVGIDLPETIHGPGVSGFDVLERCDLNVLVPSRRPMHLHARSITIQATDGIVHAVYIRRPPQPAGFRQLVGDLLRTMREQGLEPGRIMTKQMKAWPEDLPNPSGSAFPVASYKTGNMHALGEIGGIHIQIYPDGPEGWIYLAEIGTSIKTNYATRVIDPHSPRQAVPVRGPEVGRLTGTPASTEHPLPLRGMSVSLPCMARDVTGLGVQPDMLTGKPGTAKLPVPHAITIERPHAKPLSLLARQTSLEIANGEVKSVTLVRPLLPCYFEKALADIADAAKAEDADPAALKSLTAGWSEKPGPQEFSTDLRGVFEELEAHVHMKKDVTTSGWSYEMTFRYTGPPIDLAARRARDQGPSGVGPPAQERSKSTKPARPLQGQLRTGLPAISLHIPGTARQVTGLDLPAGALSGKPARASISSPHYLTIDRANGKPLWFPARETTVAIRESQVESVTIGRPILPLPLDTAVTDLRNTAKALGIEPKEIEARTAGWTEKAGSTEFSTAVSGEPVGLDTEIRMKKTAEFGGGWWYEMTFRASKLPALALPKAASEPPPPPMPQVSVRMLAPAEEIMGTDLPGDLAKQKETRLLITRTTDVTVRLPGDKTFRQRVKAAEVHVRQGVVVKVFLTPLVIATSYREMVAELVWVSNANFVAPKGQVNQQVARWPAETDRSVRRATEWLNERLRFVIAMLPKDDGRWRPVFAFVETDDAAKAAPTPSSKPAHKAPDPPGNDG
jgi:hypothetical protein